MRVGMGDGRKGGETEKEKSYRFNFSSLLAHAC